MKFITLLQLILSIVIFSTGCTQTTTGIWEKSNYSETIKYFLITSDGKKLVFVGDKHHYIFTNQEEVFKILSWEGREWLTAEFADNFSVDSEENITGSFVIFCKCANISDDQLKILLDIGFDKNSIPNKATHIYKGAISGVRYMSKDQSFEHYSSLNNDYKIRVETPYSSAGIAARVLLTPIAVTNDGIATIALIPLLALAFPFIAVDALDRQKDGEINTQKKTKESD